MGQITVARALAKLLEKMGTEVVFGVNGHGNWALLDQVVHETRIRGVPARAEDHAVQMADGWWRMRRSGPLPIVTTSVGPGNMNIVPAVATAFYESIGMVVIASAGATLASISRRNATKSCVRCCCLHRARTLPVATLSAAKRSSVPFRM